LCYEYLHRAPYTAKPWTGSLHFGHIWSSDSTCVAVAVKSVYRRANSWHLTSCDPHHEQEAGPSAPGIEGADAEGRRNAGIWARWKKKFGCRRAGKEVSQWELLSPCACVGTQAHVHRACLVRWQVGQLLLFTLYKPSY